MSRDWTPRDLYYADVEFGIKGRIRFFRFIDGDAEFPMCSDTDEMLMSEYPNFGFLFGRAEELWQRLPEQARANAFKTIDRELTDIIETDNLCETEISRWYFGELDENFYYHELNDELLMEYLLDRFGGEK